MMTFKATTCACIALCTSIVAAVAQDGYVPTAGLPTIAQELVKQIRAEPLRGGDAVVAGIATCLPEELGSAFARPDVKNAIADLHIVYFELAVRQMVEPERARTFSSRVKEEEAKHPRSAREDFELLRRGGLYEGRMLLCVAATARGALTK